MSKYSELIQALELRAKNAAVDRLIAEYGPAGGNPNAKQSDHIEHIAAAALRELEAALAQRSKQIGVACDEHDLTHALACGRCYDTLRARVAELEAENLRLTQDLSAGGRDQHSKDARIAELEAQVTEIPTLCRRYEAEIAQLESRLAAALHLIPGNVLLGELRELAERYRAALEDKG